MPRMRGAKPLVKNQKTKKQNPTQNRTPLGPFGLGFWFFWFFCFLPMVLQPQPLACLVFLVFYQCFFDLCACTCDFCVSVCACAMCLTCVRAPVNAVSLCVHPCPHDTQVHAAWCVHTKQFLTLTSFS